MKGKIKVISVAALGLTLLPLLVLAQVPEPKITSLGDISLLIQRILNWIEGIVFAIALIMLLYAAILFLTAGASETIHTKAKNVLIFAVVGIAVAILAKSFEPFLLNLFTRR